MSLGLFDFVGAAAEEQRRPLIQESTINVLLFAPTHLDQSNGVIMEQHCD